MRWSTIRLIWGRELRDQLRDRRTMFVMILLPLLIYPLGGVGLMQIVLGSGPKRSVIGISGARHLPPEIHLAEQPLLAFQPLDALEKQWIKTLNKVRFTRKTLPENFDQPFSIDEPDLKGDQSQQPMKL